MSLVSKHDDYSDDTLRDIFRRVKTIAVVGASDRPSRPSHGVMLFLAGRGYRVFAVNPQLTVRRIGDIDVYPRLADIPDSIDMIDVFRDNAALPAVLDEVLQLDPLPSVFWTQLGIRDDAVAARAERHGIEVVMDRCPKIDGPRLFGP